MTCSPKQTSPTPANSDPATCRRIHYTTLTNHTPHLSKNEGVLLTVEPAIKSIIIYIDQIKNHEIIIEDLDDMHLMIREDMEVRLKEALEEVSPPTSHATPEKKKKCMSKCDCV